MAKIALVCMSASDTPEGRGRMVHALKTAAALKAKSADAQLYFHGIGVTWLNAFHAREDRFTQHYGPAFDEIRDMIAGACNFCTNERFGAAAGATGLGVTIVGDDGTHHTVADLLADGVHVVTF